MIRDDSTGALVVNWTVKAADIIVFYGSRQKLCLQYHQRETAFTKPIGILLGQIVRCASYDINTESQKALSTEKVQIFVIF